MTAASIAPRLIIKVLDSRAPRESDALPAGPVTVGYALDNDIVLRDATVKGCRTALDLDGAPVAGLRVLEGEVRLLGQVLTAPARAVLPPYVPLAFGEVLVAYGEADHSRWAEALRLAQAIRLDTQPPAAREPLLLPSRINGLMGRGTPYLPAALGLLALAFATAAAQGDFRGVAHAATASSPSAVSKVHSLQSAGSRAEDAFLSLGVAATAVLDPTGGLSISVPADADPPVVDEARRQFLQHNADVKQIRIVFGRAKRPASPAPSDSAKRIVAAVDGPAGYLIAADGSRYFAGARLPTGQVLTSIDRNAAAFEQDGVSTQLTFQNEGERP